MAGMGRKRRAWLTHGNGKRTVAGRTLPGYYVEWRENGRHRTQHFDRLKTAREAVRTLNDRFERLAAGGLLPMTLVDAIGELNTSARRLARATRADFATTFSRFAAYAGGDTAVASIGPADIDGYLASLADLREATAAKHWRYLRRLFRWCISRGYCAADPTAGVTVRPASRARDLAALPSDRDIKRLVAAIADDRLRVALLIGLTTGLDRGVVASLTAADVDLDQRCIKTRRTKTRRRGGRMLVVPLHVKLIPTVRRICADTQPGVPLFPDYRRRAWYRTAREAAGPPWTELTVADFRKIASARLQSVMPLTAVQQILGHSTVETTARHYSPLDPSVRRACDTLPLPSLTSSRRAKKRKHA